MSSFVSEKSGLRYLQETLIVIKHLVQLQRIKMQSEKKITKYIKAIDDSDQQRRALKNLINEGLADHKEVVDFG